MKTKQIIGLALLVAGIAGLYMGYTASESVLEQASQSLTGRYTDETTWYMMGGAVATVTGLALMVFGKN